MQLKNTELFLVSINCKGFPCGSAGKESASNVGDLDLIPGLGRSPGEGKGYPLQHSGLKHTIDCVVHGVAKSDMTERLSFHFTSLHKLQSIVMNHLREKIQFKK